VRDGTTYTDEQAEAREVGRVLDGTPDTVLIFDRVTLRFSYVNQGGIEQLGYRRDELLSMTALHIQPGVTDVEFRAVLGGLSPGEACTYPTVYRRKDGTDISMEVLLQHPYASLMGGSAGMVSIGRDLTHRSETEQLFQTAEREAAVMEDRQRIARDLHDRVIQRLFAAGLGIEAFRGRVRDPLFSERLAHVVDELDCTIRELRSLIFELTFTSSTPSLRAMVIDVCTDERTALGFDPTIHFDGPVDTLGDSLGDHLVAVLREALSNVARHAHATRVQVTVAAAGNLTLRVEDNGSGPAADAWYRGGNGLATMLARAEKLDGSCDLTRASPTGGALEWQVPLP
jgi:PAS domain S-box-containing protein